MSDVAKLAGVSSQTVSRVLNEDRYVATETRERVLDAVQMLGYRRNSAARALSTGRSHTIGVAVFDTTYYGPASTLAAVEHAADEAGYAITIASLHSLDRGAVAVAVERLQRQSVDGILVIAPLSTSVNALPFLTSNVPLVAVETGPEHGIPVASVDQLTGATLATEHLLGLGHATVRHIAGPDQFLEAEQRLAGWRGALEAASAQILAPLAGDWSAQSGYQAGNQLFGEMRRGAVFVANDQMALGVMRAAHETGLRIPQDVSIVGFDNVPEAAYYNPPLTTVHQDFPEVGRRSVLLLLEQIDVGADAGVRHELVAPELVVRHTTAPPVAEP